MLLVQLLKSSLRAKLDISERARPVGYLHNIRLCQRGKLLGTRDSLISRLMKDARPRKRVVKKTIQTHLSCIIRDRHLFIYSYM